jgi:hypothetical protein
MKVVLILTILAWFAHDEAQRRGGVPFLEKWGGSLAVLSQDGSDEQMFGAK